MSSGGFGGGSFGGMPWGGAAQASGALPPDILPDGFDLYCFYHSPESMGSILSGSGVSVAAAGGLFFDNPVTHDLELSSGGVVPDTTAALQVVSSVPQTWTLQTIFTAPNLPNDFSSITTSHFYIGASDAAGPSAGLFFSKAGVAYSGAVTHSGGGIIELLGPFQVIPGTPGLLQEGIEYTVRLAADLVTEVVYVFITRTVDLLVTGHRLVALLPAIKPTDLITSTVDRTVVSVKGEGAIPTKVLLDQLCLGSGLVIPNLPPRADAGADQALRTCSVVRLDGSASVDPEGSALVYNWRLIDAPPPSEFAFEGADGFTLPEAPPSGFTDKFYSAELGAEDASDPVLSGDVLLVGGTNYTIIGTGVDLVGFFVQTASDVMPDDLAGAVFRLLRQRALSDVSAVSPTFFPDVPGFYKFDLQVNDGQLSSDFDIVVVNVLESLVPRGCAPDLTFIWRYMSDFWRLVEDREQIQAYMEGMAQVVAGELLTLWQVDYSKSLRDIQRTIQRKWLHYNLLLAEPLPGLTEVRIVYGGITSVTVPSTGAVGVSGTQLVIESPIHDPVVIPYVVVEPVPAALLALYLRNKLQAEDSRYTVTELDFTDGSSAVRIHAPFPFSVGDSTTSTLFAVSENASLSGSAGTRIGDRVYRVPVSLEGLDIAEEDMLVVGGEGYLISRIADDPSDPIRFQRVVVQRDLPLLPGSDWAIPGHVTSQLLDFYNGAVTAGDVVTFEVVEEGNNSPLLVDVPAVGASQLFRGRLGCALELLGVYLAQPESYTVRLAKVLRRSHVPVGGLVVDIPALQENIVERNEARVLVRNVDYFIGPFRNGSAIRFQAGKAGDIGDVWEGANPPDRLWAEVTYLDNSPTIEANFGIPAEFTLDKLSEISSDLDYLSAVRGLWFTLLNGPTMYNLRVGTQILLGLPFAEEDGVIEELRTDFSPSQGRILVRDSRNNTVVRSYTYPRVLGLETNPATGEEYKEGDEVERFAPLVAGAEVLDYVKDPHWFEGYMRQGVFFEVEKFHKFLVRVDNDAFSLSALLFVRDFILKVKPTYTLPLFVVLLGIGDTEVSVTDEVSMVGRLYLNDGPCFGNNGAGMWDDYRPSGGGVYNQYDADDDPDNAPPAYPTSQQVFWGYDKLYLCPEDEILLSYCLDHPGGVIQYDSIWAFDAANSPGHQYSDAPLNAVPAGPAGHTLSGGPSLAAHTSDIEAVKVRISGTLGADPGDYEIVIEVNSVDVHTEPVTVSPSGVIQDFAVSVPVTAGDSIEVRIRPASGGARAPSWNTVDISLLQTAEVWQYDSGIAAGIYCHTVMV